MYLILYKNELDQLECDYITYNHILSILSNMRISNNKKSLYFFKYNKDQDILYLNYPLNFYYKKNKINDTSFHNHNNNEKIESDQYVEIRICKYPQLRVVVNIDNLGI
jgi:hypothetical protein